jgi:hypothetical protein
MKSKLSFSGWTAAEATRNVSCKKLSGRFVFFPTQRDYAETLPETITEFAAFANSAEETG